MKRIKKYIALALSCLTLFSVAACGSDTDKEEKPTGATTTVQGSSEKVEGTLHRVNVTPSNRPFIVGGKTEYKVVIADADAEAQTAANFIVKHLTAATGASIKAVEYSAETTDYTASARYIYVGKNEAFEKAGLTMPNDDLGPCGYFIKTAGNSAFIATSGKYGYQMGAIAFLREVVGYDMYADDCVSYDRTPSTLPDMDITERPDFDYRHWSNPLSEVEQYGMGYSMHKAMISVGGSEMHNSLKWLPPDKFLTEHSSWYASDLSQLCYTAHGDPEEYEAMQQEIHNQMIEYANANPDIDTIGIAQEDTPNSCTCDACTAAVATYGNINGTTIPFLNDVADRINAYFAEQAKETNTEPRTLYIIQFAYQQTFTPPVKQNENGEWVPIDETVRCRYNVGVEIAPLEARFTKDLDHEDNKLYAEAIEQWSSVTNNIYYWWYETNFHDYFLPYNCWSTMVDQYRFCFKNSRRYMFNEGQLGQANPTAFTKLKDYIDSKALFDVNVDTEAVIDKFFKGYFGPAAEPMREFFDEVQTYMTYLQNTYPDKLTGSIYEKVAKENATLFWKKKTLEGYLEYIDRAYAAIESVKDESLYTAYNDHITLESLFPRYVLCKYYDGTMTTEELYKMRSEFKADNVRFGNTWEQEHYPITSLWSAWGV